MNGGWRGMEGDAFTARFTMEYDHKGRLIKAKSFSGDVSDQCVFSTKKAG